MRPPLQEPTVVFGITTAHPMAHLGHSFVATVPKTAVAPGVPYTFKAVAWTADADWTSEDDAIYYRETTFSLQ